MHRHCGGRSRLLIGAAVLALAAPVAAAPLATGSATAAPAVQFHPGSASLHDPLVPGYGNGGYNVGHYDIFLHYNAATGLLTGRTTITARLTQNLSRFNLDFVLPVTAVTVNGAKADFALERGRPYQLGKELVVTPAHGLPKGSRMTVVVAYQGKPRDIRIEGYSEWNRTPTGITVWDEPTAAAEWWYPGNDYPSDKAAYDVTVTTTKADQVISNGTLMSRTVHGAQATTHWRTGAPMATYLSFLTIGRYDVVRGHYPGGTPFYTAYERTGSVFMKRARRDVSLQPSIVGTLQKWFGPYPFGMGGAVVSQPRVASAFETQTRPSFLAQLWNNSAHNVWAVVHETAHQWYGDDVTMSRWRHLWLAEGFATYAEWLWSQAHGHGSTEQLFESTYHQYPPGNKFWKVPVIHPKWALDDRIYERGAMTLQALRNVVGSQTFFQIVRSWLRQHRHGNGDSRQFATLASRISGKDLTPFFNVWLDSAHRPAPIPRNGFPREAQERLQSGQLVAPSSLGAIERSDTALERRQQW